MRLKLIASTFALGAVFALGQGVAHADPITCPPGQAAVLNPSEDGWTCQNPGGNVNLSEDPRNDKFDKTKF